MSKTYDKEKRKKIFDEIIDTEEKYLLSLETLNKNYIVPLKKNKYLKFGRELNSIVSNLTVIVNFNNHLLSKLKQTNEDDIGKTFQMIIPFLKTYTQYFSNYEAALNSIREADKNPKNKRFSEWLKKTDDRAKEQGQQTFKQLLIQPVQRIPRYNLLLSEVLKNTPKTHVDYENLRSASDKMKEVADHLNRQITEIENRNKLIKLKEIFVLNNTGKGVMTNIVEPHRKYVFEGELHVLSETSSINKQKHYFFLFSDIMVCCKEVPEELKRKLIEEKKAAQQSQANSKKLGGLKIFSRKSDAGNSDTDHNQFGAFDDDENEIPDHFYTITFTIKFTDKIGTGNTPVSSPMMAASTPTSPSMESSTNVEEIWVRDFSFMEGRNFQFPNIFQLITGTETYTFESTDAKSREKWVNHLNNTLDELKKKKKDTTKDRAKAKGFPVVMVNSAALVIQALARGKLTRGKKGDVENRFKPRKKTTKLNTNPLGATSPSSPTADSIPTGPVTIDHTDVNVTAPPEKSPRPVEEPIAKVEEPVTKPITPRVIDENPSQEPTSVIDAATIPPQTNVVEEPQETSKPVEEPKQVEVEKPVEEPIVEKPTEPVTEPYEDNTSTTTTEEEPKPVEPEVVDSATVEEPKVKQPEIEEPKQQVDPGITTTIEEPEDEEPATQTTPESTNNDAIKKSPRESISDGLRSPLSSPRLYRKDSNEEFKSPTKEEDEEVYFDEEGNVLPPWKVELMKKFKKSGKFNAILAQQNDNKKVEKKIDMPNKKLQLNAIRSMFEEKDKLAKEEMHTLRKAKESPQNTSSSSLK
ncbi:rhoGEF domain-containing protein [Naegleria gruberi]|uniref:RhoGEF domain-containing protein n=1 Tax=Naegleria gruberi TaxID=5762 RepID=D2V205_NAEGR|nr:rhoGEF domain-containing protein [Naegleria gruberi]EFC49251.1 rhoGEF domain-containing protein [Naegleria gruberi]|eukprot:XP_002681995.1 rhoGEF domain-containing protein [Naegleria gruberi strain NEG-M]